MMSEHAIISKVYISLVEALYGKDYDEKKLTQAVEEAIGYLGEILDG